MIKRFGFTLAEVLITLTIIGVVAALTIPTLMANYQKTQYVTGLKKTIAVWDQALAQMAADAGCPGDLSCFFDSSDTQTMYNKMLPYFKVAKVCNIDLTLFNNSECFINYSALYYDGSHVTHGPINYSFRLADGSGVSMWSPVAGCNFSLNGIEKVCMGTLEIDVNGNKKPNAFGRDIFVFYISTEKGPMLHPPGMAGDSDYWKTSNYCVDTNAFGKYCAARIMEEGWEMNY